MRRSVAYILSQMDVSVINCPGNKRETGRNICEQKSHLSDNDGSNNRIKTQQYKNVSKFYGRHVSVSFLLVYHTLMGVNASQITGTSTVCSSIFFWLTSKKTPKLHFIDPLWGETTGDWWTHLIKGQQCRDRFHDMTSPVALFANMD